MFYSTNQAVAAGLVAGPEDLAWFSRLRKEFIRQCSAALDREELDLAMVLATQAQFYREALEARIFNRQLHFFR